MAARLFNPSLRYFPPGTRRIYWLNQVANPTAPTRAELDAGTDLSAEMVDMTGWIPQTTVLDIPDIPSRFIGQANGRISIGDSAIRFYQSQNSKDIRQFLVPFQRGYVVALWDGDIAGNKMDVFPVQVASMLPQPDPEQPGICEVHFYGTLSTPPGIALPIPPIISPQPPVVTPPVPVLIPPTPPSPAISPFPFVPGRAVPGAMAPGST